MLFFSLIKNSKSYRTVALLVVPATFITIGVLLVKGLNANQKGLEILLDIQWDTLWKLDVSLLDIFIYKWSMIVLYLLKKIKCINELKFLIFLTKTTVLNIICYESVFQCVCQPLNNFVS